MISFIQVTKKVQLCEGCLVKELKRLSLGSLGDHLQDKECMSRPLP